MLKGLTRRDFIKKMSLGAWRYELRLGLDLRN